MLFDQRARTDGRSQLRSEPYFKYLDRSAEPKAKQIRQQLETWFSEYPTAHRPELKTRLSDDFHSAFFELLLFILMRRWGCKVEVHPDVPNTTKHPDFSVQAPNDESFYLEATVATSMTKEEAKAQKRVDKVYETLDKHLSSSGFWLAIHVGGAPRTAPPGKRLANCLGKWLASLKG